MLHGRKSTFRIVVQAAVALLVPGCGAGAHVSVETRPGVVTFSNDVGAWTIFTACRGPRSHGGRDVTVGPGYVARLVLASGTVVTDDEHATGGLNAPGNGGLGAFGWHASRRHGSSFDYDDAWTIDGRRCAHDDWGRFRPVATGVGVVRARVLEAATVAISPDGTPEGRLTIDVMLKDNQVPDRKPLMRVRYRYRVHPDSVDVWTSVVELCGFGRCGWGSRPAFVKEPKLAAAVTGGGFTRMAVFDAGAASPGCLWTGVDPRAATGQCDAPERELVRFDFGDGASGADGRCSPERPCLDVLMRAHSAAVGPGGVDAPWQGAGLGLDGWAVASATRHEYAATDSGLDGVRWSCKSASTAAPILRRWELVGGARQPGGRYRAASVLFNGWEGGRGFGDCEPAARLYGPRGEGWGAHATYSVDEGASASPLGTP